MRYYYHKKVAKTMPLEQLPEKDTIFKKTKYSKILENNSNKTFHDITKHATTTTTTTTSVLMPLSQLTVNFLSNSLSSFLSILRILSSQAISFQILLYALFPRFPWSTLLPFPSYFNFHNLISLWSTPELQIIRCNLQRKLI